MKTLTKEQRVKLLAAIDLPTDHLTDIGQLSGRVVIFQKGEVLNGGCAILHYEPENPILVNFKEPEFEQVLVD